MPLLRSMLLDSSDDPHVLAVSDPAGRLLHVEVRLGALDVGWTSRSRWMSRPQFACWKHTHLTIDVVPGRGPGFSLEAPRGVRFLIRSRLLTDAGSAWLGQHRVEGTG